MTRVLFIVTQSEMGGAQRFMLELTAALDRARFEAHVAAGPRGNWELLDKAEEAGIKTHKLPSLARAPMPWHWPKVIRDIQALIDKTKPDILFLNSSSAGFLGAIAARNIDIPVVYRIGGWAFNDPRPRWQRWPIIWAEGIVANWKDVIVVNSEHDRLQAKEMDITPRRGVITISNGLNASSIDFFDPPEARAKLSEAASENIDGGFLIGNVANFYLSKAHNVLLTAFAELKRRETQDASDIKLVLIGDGFLRPQIERDIKRLNLENSVFLTGQLENARRYLKGIDAFALSSKKEGFPWTILEAAAAGVPITATDVGGNSDFVKNGTTGLLVAPNDPVAFADALEHIVTDKELRDRLVRGASQMLEEHFSKRTMVLTYERLFEKLRPQSSFSQT